MTISTTDSVQIYAGDGSTVTFTYGYVFFDLDEVKVELQDASGNISYPTKDGSGTYDYSVSGTYDDATSRYPNGGDVTFNTTPPSGYTVAIYREVTATQSTDYVENNSFPAESHENALDRLTLLVQRALLDSERALKLPYTESGDPVLPPLEANKYPRVNVDGDALEWVESAPTAGLQVDLYSDLKALAAGVVRTAVVAGRSSIGDGGGGTFVWVSGDQSTNVANDPGEGVWVPPGSDTSGVSGAWKRQHGITMNVKWFGAIGDGVTDDVIPINRAIQYGRVIEFPGGNYRTTSSIIVDGTRKYLFGNSASIFANDLITAIKCESTATDIFIKDIHIEGNFTGDSIIAIDVHSPRTRVSGCSTFNVDTGIRSFGARFFLTECDIRAINPVVIEGTAEVRAIENCIIDSYEGTGVGLQIRGGAGIRVINCDILSNSANYNLLMDPDTNEVASVKFVGVYFDQGSINCAKLITSGTGSIRRINFESCWFVGSTGSGFYAQGDVIGLQLLGCEVYGNGDKGIRLAELNSVIISNCFCGGNAQQGIEVFTTTKINIVSNIVGNASGFGANNVGVEMGGTSDEYIINANNILGNISGNLIDEASGVNKSIANNLV